MKRNKTKQMREYGTFNGTECMQNSFELITEVISTLAALILEILSLIAKR